MMAANQGVPERLQQAEFLWQDAASQRRDDETFRAALGAVGPQNYLLVAGKRHATLFSTRVFDAHPFLRLDHPVSWATWRTQVRTPIASCKAWLRDIRLGGGQGWRLAANNLRCGARWRALWSQGSFALTAKRRADPRAEAVDAVVLHWDMCNSSGQCLRVLGLRGLSAHLLVDRDGMVYQLLDLAHEAAFHAGWINERSVGVEINNPVDPRLRGGEAQGRPVVSATLAHTHEAGHHLDFTAVQKTVVAQLVAFLSAHLAVPQQLPASIDAEGVEATPALVDRSFRGICGHYHVGDHKADPGATLWPVLRRAWRKADPSAAGV